MMFGKGTLSNQRAKGEFNSREIFLTKFSSAIAWIHGLFEIELAMSLRRLVYNIIP
jgi:hypothetical protein